MARITSYQQLLDMRDANEISDVEWQLIENCKLGQPTVLNDGERPTEASPDCAVQAELLRYLILGGCDDCRLDQGGLWLDGALVTGRLELNYVSAWGGIRLLKCRFEDKIFAQNARLNSLNLSGSFVPGLTVQGAKISGSVFLRHGFHADGEVRVASAEIDGQLDCVDGIFDNPEGFALMAERVKVTKSILLRGGFTAKGSVSFVSARVADIYLEDCSIDFEPKPDTKKERWALKAEGMVVAGRVMIESDARISGGVKLAGTKVGNKLSISGCQLAGHQGGTPETHRPALEAGGLWARRISWRADTVDGDVHFNDATCETLNDKLEAWPADVKVNLDGFVYEHLARVGSFEQRLEWANRSQARDGEFSPHPLRQLAKVLRDMGHDAQARRALVLKERRTAQERRRLLKPGSEAHNVSGGQKPFHLVARGGLWCWDKAVDITVGYGFFPQRSVVILAVLISLATFVFHRAYQGGYFAPNAGVILVSEEWQKLAELPRCSGSLTEDCASNPAEEWSAKGAAGQDYETFNRYAYAADVVIPIINLGQEAAWAPSTTRGVQGELDWGFVAWWARWVFSLLGWLVTAFGAAAITGIIRRD